MRLVSSNTCVAGYLVLLRAPALDAPVVVNVITFSAGTTTSCFPVAAATPVPAAPPARVPIAAPFPPPAIAPITAPAAAPPPIFVALLLVWLLPVRWRSEERRVGKEGTA